MKVVLVVQRAQLNPTKLIFAKMRQVALIPLQRCRAWPLLIDRKSVVRLALPLQIELVGADLLVNR